MSEPTEITVARQVYERGIEAWLADKDAGRCLSTGFWEPRGYIIRAIADALREAECVSKK